MMRNTIAGSLLFVLVPFQLTSCAPTRLTAVPASHPANSSAPEGSYKPRQYGLGADDYTTHTRQLISSQKAADSEPQKKGGEHSNHGGM